MNSPRDFIREICAEEGIEVMSLSHDYVLQLTKNDVSRRIFGAYWDLNSAAADRIACDKTACYNILHSICIPSIKHELIFNPLKRMGFPNANGAWNHALGLFKAFGGKVVVKPNQGTKGQDVYYCDSIPTFEAAAQTIFLTYPDAAVSPYQDIETEYRVFYIDGKCPFVYGKSRGETWQHNLSQGASAFEIPESEANKKRLAVLKALASRAAEGIGICFATIDIAESQGEGMSVLEINSGVQARQLLEQIPNRRDTIKAIYRAAVLKMLL